MHIQCVTIVNQRQRCRYKLVLGIESKAKFISKTEASLHHETNAQ